VLEQLKQTFFDYHHRTSRLPYGRRVVTSLARQIGHAESLLDVGCGDGTNTRALADQIGAKRIVGADVLVRSTATIEVHPYDGIHLPFPDRSFEAVSIVDVLHHCTEPRAVLKEIMRVADKVVAIKDHFVYGPVTRTMIYYMDIAGNAKDAIPVPGTYFEPQQWIEMIAEAGGRIEALEWPLKTHDLPWRIVAWPQLHFTARVVPIR
jgi:ubiquinone/menaquinone biosynthesis C-methylase UbiE